MGAIRESMRRRPLLAFFVLAFAISWGSQIAAIALAERQALALSNEDNTRHLLALLRLRLAPADAAILGLFILSAGPLLAALLVTWAVDGRRGLAELWGRITQWRVGPRWYLVILALPLALAAGSLALGALAGGLGTYAPRLSPAYFLPFLLYLLVFTGLVEEPGWRGFALPRLQRRYSAVKASWILGVLWGAWHIPFIAYYNRATGTVGVVPILVALVLTAVGWTIVNTWIYNSTESVFLMIVLHGWYNTVNSYLVLSSQNALAQTLSGILPWALAIVLLRAYGGEDLAAKPRPRAEPFQRPAGGPARGRLSERPG